MELRFTAGIDRNQFRSDIDAMRRDILGLNNTVKSETSKMDSAFKNLSLGIAGYFSVNAVQGFVRELINVRGEFQKTEIAFTTMLGNADQAKSLMADMVELAAKTPFSLQDVSSGAKQLLAFQVPANEVVDTLTRLGNIAAGLSVPLSRINLVYGQVKAKGKLMGDDLRQFTEAGIPMVAELAKKFGTTTAEISKMVSAGKIGFKDVQDVLFSMTNEGGMFFNLMEKQSKSLSGQIANLGDSFDQMLNSIGESNEGFLSDSIASINYLVQNYETVIEVIGVAVATYGAYRAALIATAALQQLSAGAALQQALAQGTLTTAQAYGAAASVTFQRAQASLNATLLANPIGIVIGLIAGLTYVIYKNITATTQWEELQGKLNETTKKGIDNAEEQQSKINTLIGVIRNKNTTDNQAKKALDEINRLTGNRIKGLTIEGIRIGNNTKAISGYIEMLKKEARAKALVETITAAELNNKEIDRDNPNNLTIGERFGNFDELSDLASCKTPQQRKQEVMLKSRLANNKLIKEGNAELQKLYADGVNIFNDTGNKESAALNNSANETEKVAKKKKEAVEKIYGEDTIKGLQQRTSKLNEVMETSVFGSEKYNIAKSQKTALEAQLKEMTSGFDEQITELKRQFSVRDKLLEAGYSKETVDGMFPEIKDKNLLQSMQDQAKALKDIIDSGKGNSQTAENLSNINEQIRVMLGQKSALEEFSKTLDLGRNGKSYSEYIDFLNSQKTTGGSELDLAKNAEIQKRIDAEIEAQKDKFNALLEEQRTYEEKSLALQKEYDDMRALAKTDAEKEKVDKSYSKKFTDLFFEQMQGSEEWTKVFTDMNLVATTKLEEFKRILQAKLSEAKTTEEKIKIGEFIKKINDTISQRNPYTEIERAVKSMGDEALSAEEKLELLRKGIAAANGYLSIMEGIINDVEQSIDLLGGSTDNAMGDILHGIKETIAGIKEAMEGFEDLKESQKSYLEAKDAGDTFGQVMSGIGMVGAAVKIVGGAIKAVSGWLNGDKKKERQIKAWANEVNNLKVQYQELERAIDKALGSDKYSAQQNVIANLEKQKILLQQMIQKEDAKKKTDQGKIDDWRNSIQAVNREIEDIKDSIVNDILQIDAKGLADKIGNALIEGFGKGEDALQSLNKMAEDVFKDMVKHALNMQLQKSMQPILDDMLSSMGFSKDGKNNISGSFDSLTPEERERIKKRIQEAGVGYQKALEQYKDLFGGIDAQASSLSGGIKGITEDTAGIIAGQFTAVRVNVGEILMIHKKNNQAFIQQLSALSQIEQNTRPIKALYDVVDGMDRRLRNKGF